MQKWDYLEIKKSWIEERNIVAEVNGVNFDWRKGYPDFHPYLQELGNQGWELVTREGDLLYFKRPLE